jgi:hypothetical protein
MKPAANRQAIHPMSIREPNPNSQQVHSRKLMLFRDPIPDRKPSPCRRPMHWQARTTSGTATEWTAVQTAGSSWQTSSPILRKSTPWGGISCRAARLVVTTSSAQNTGFGCGAASAIWLWRYRARGSGIMTGSSTLVRTSTWSVRMRYGMAISTVGTSLRCTNIACPFRERFG